MLHPSVCLSVCLYLSLDLFGPVCILESRTREIVSNTSKEFRPQRSSSVTKQFCNRQTDRQTDSTTTFIVQQVHPPHLWPTRTSPARCPLKTDCSLRLIPTSQRSKHLRYPLSPLYKATPSLSIQPQAVVNLYCRPGSIAHSGKLLEGITDVMMSAIYNNRGSSGLACETTSR